MIAHEASPRASTATCSPPATTRVINQRQFRAPGLHWPTEYRYPDETYRDTLDVDVGGETFELHHARGETDDHTWMWVAGAQGAVHRRPVHLGVAQLRQPAEGAALRRATGRSRSANDGRARRRDAAARPRPADRRRRPRARRRSTDGAELLESLLDQTLALMNEGARLDDIVHTRAARPQHLLERPYLRPVYDEPEFVVRNIWRLYGGWYDGNPAHLKPAPEAALAARARRRSPAARRGSPSGPLELAAAGDLRLAGHLAELAALGRARRQGRARGAGRGVRAPRRDRGVDDVEGHLLVGRAREPAATYVVFSTTEFTTLSWSAWRRLSQSGHNTSSRPGTAHSSVST